MSPFLQVGAPLYIGWGATQNSVSICQNWVLGINSLKAFQNHWTTGWNRWLPVSLMQSQLNLRGSNPPGFCNFFLWQRDKKNWRPGDMFHIFHAQKSSSNLLPGGPGSSSHGLNPLVPWCSWHLRNRALEGCSVECCCWEVGSLGHGGNTRTWLLAGWGKTYLKNDGVRQLGWWKSQDMEK